MGVEIPRKHTRVQFSTHSPALIDTINQSSVQKKSLSKNTTLYKIDLLKKTVLASVHNVWGIVIPYYFNRNVRRMQCRGSGSAFTSKGYNLCKGHLTSDVGEFADFTLTTALRTWPSCPRSKRSTFPRRHSCLGILCSCRHTMSPTCFSRSEFALLECRWCSQSSVRYSDRHQFQKWSRIRCRSFALLVSVVTSFRPTSLRSASWWRR